MMATTSDGKIHRVHFRSEAFSSIPLPPEVSFALALSQLDADSNSFYLLELDEATYLQCGGSPSACTVEVRSADADGVFRSHVVSRDPAARTPVHVDMSRGGVWVHEGEVLTIADAACLFECLFTRQPLPPRYVLRDRELDKVEPPADEDDVDELGLRGQEVPADDDAPAVRWLAANDPGNAFGSDGYDCSACVRSLISTTPDARVANSFLEHRASTGAEHTGYLPDHATALDGSMTCELTRPLAAGAVFQAADMEDKWDIFHHSDRLVFCRSWTGRLELVAEVRQDRGSLSVRRVWVDSDNIYGDAELPVRIVDYLIRSHVLGHAAPHPLPSSLPRTAQDVGHYSFGMFGRNCNFGSFETWSPA